MKASRKIVAVLASSALACSLMAAPAFAADEVKALNETTVTFESVPTDQLKVKAPTLLNVAGNESGSITTPTDMEFENMSTVDVKIKSANMKYDTSLTDKLNLVTTLDAGNVYSDTNKKIELVLNLTANESTFNLADAITTPAALTNSWSMQAGEKMALTASGSVTPGVTDATSYTVGTIEWMVAPL